MHVAKAYCVELGRSIDIIEARQAYFAQKSPRPRFTFNCSSPECRVDQNSAVTIVGINYDKTPEDDASFQQAHFRSKDLDAHSPDCQWVIEDEARKQLAQKKTSGERKSRRPNIAVEGKYIRRSNFLSTLLRSAGDNETDQNDKKEHQPRERRASSRAKRLQSAKKQVERGITSNSFHELVHCYLELRRERKWDTPLSISGLPIQSYSQFFKKIDWYDPRYMENHAYYGSVSVTKVYPFGHDFSDGFPVGISLRFNQAVELGETKAKPTLYLTDQMFESSPNGHVLAETIQTALDESNNFSSHMWCHFYGEIEEETISNEKDGKVSEFSVLKVSPRSIETLELILRPKAKKTSDATDEEQQEG